MSWSKHFIPAIALPEGGELLTLDDARAYILKLPKKTQMLQQWQDATGALLLVGNEPDGPEMFARMGMTHALYPKGEPVFDCARKNVHWGRQRPVRDR